MIRAAFLITLVFVADGCHRARHGALEASDGVTLRADSAQFGLHLDGPPYGAEIGFQFVNQSGTTLSMNHCQAPAPPTLEKQLRDGTWVLAYSPVLLMCRTMPPFRIPDGGSYHSVLRVAAGRPGANTSLTFEPDSLPALYRLHWELRRGDDPDNHAEPLVSAVSPSFRLIVR